MALYLESLPIYLQHLIPQLPPDTDKIASLIFRPYFGALLFEDYDHALSIYSILRG